MIERESFYLLYNLSYFLLALFVIFLSLKFYFKGVNSGLSFNSNFLFNLFSLLFIFLIGLRAYNVGTDTINYYRYWSNYSNFEFESDYLFYFLLNLINRLGFGFQTFLITITLLYFSFIIRGLKILSKNFYLTRLFLLFVFLSFFFSLTTSINVIRQGLSLAILFYSFIAYKNLKINKKVFFFYLLMASFTHITALIPTLMFFIANRYHTTSPLRLVPLYFLGIIMAFNNIGLLNVAPFLENILQNDKRAVYLDVDFELYEVGFKPQFVFFNTIFLGIFFLIRKRLNNTKNYNIFLNYYILSSFIFFMAFQMAFSDRWGLFSWFFIPVLLTPIFVELQKFYKYLMPLSIFLFLIFIYFNVYD
ncbi:EpsG family protein [Mesonia sp. HuA40]|uniref:EpsG family protein n=1 Tax=Mesonia sp. HuA40 TaxID=2602761 RepID=UPI0011C6FAEA|nr:EpsG family protein [Mesonia sp. HuA40]TXK75413.1 EpsG family protein [Mesonia sp. HuA40]